jgi:hypothetical protein
MNERQHAIGARVVWTLTQGHKVHARVVRRHAELLGVDVPDEIEDFLSWQQCDCRDCRASAWQWKDRHGVFC